METLTSLKNPRVQAWRALKDRKARKETGLFLVEGRKMVDEALRSDFPVEAVLVSEAMADAFALPGNVPVFALPEHVLGAVCDTKTPQGIAAVLRMKPSAAPDGRRLIALDGVQDPGNVGTIIRTADAAGLNGVLLSGACADVYSPKVLRATMGSVFHLPIMVTERLPETLGTLRKNGWNVISSQLDGEEFYGAAAHVGKRFCLVVGNEGNGVTEEVKALANCRLKLPMRGRAESLNVAVAAGIMMYELTRGSEG